MYKIGLIKYSENSISIEVYKIENRKRENENTLRVAVPQDSALSLH
jgi:hypothetical protein